MYYMYVTNKNAQVIELRLTYEETGGSSLLPSDLAITDAPVALSFDLYNNSSAQTVSYTTSSTGAITIAPASPTSYFSYTHTPGTNGGTIIVTPLAVTPSAQTITVSQAADANYAAGSATFTVTVANTTPTVNVTYHANGGTGADIVETPYQGSDYPVAANTFSYMNHSFTKWNTNEGGTGTDYLPGATIENISEDIDLYAQWEEVNEVVDVIDRAFTGISGGSGYGSWSGKVGASGAVYAGNSAGGASTSNPSIQLRTSSSNSGIVSTTSGGKVTKVEVTWNSSTSSGRKLDIYGKNSAYTAATDLYDNNAGTLIGSITCGNNNSTVLTINSDYTFIGMRSNSNAIYLDEIQITWEPVSSDVVATPVINPNGGSFWESQEVSITCATDDATIYYTTNGDDPTNESEVYNAPFTITATNTVKAFAVKADMTDSEIATAEFTKATPMTVAQALAVTPPQNGVYVGGIISEITEVSTQYHNATYKISDDGTHSSELTVFRGKYLNGENFTSEDQIQVGDVVVVYGDLGTYNEAIQLNQNNYLVSLVRPEKAATPTFSPAAGTYYAAQNVTINCETEGATIYYTTDGSNPTTESSVYSEAIDVNTTTTIKAFAVVDGKDDSDIATAEYTIVLTPTITVTPATATPSASDTDGTLDLTCANLTITGMDDFDIQYCDAEGEEAEQPDWIEVLVAEQDPTIGEGYVVSFTMDENTVEEARTAYFKVYAMDDEELVYSNLVTVTQAAFVIDYATLPFEWEGGPKSTFNALTGVTTYGLGSDYADSNAPYLIKLDTDGDYIQIKTNEQPGKVTIGVKMLGGTSTSTITVQGSADGQTFADVEDLTISGTSTTTELTLETTNDFASTDRYVRLYFTKGSNVGVGPITIAKYVAPSTDPYITVADDEIHATADGKNDYVAITYGYLDINDADDFDIQFYDAEGNELEEDPTWIQADVTTQTGQEGYFVYYIIDENDGDARTTYFKVFAIGDSDYVYSNIVTVSQAAPAITYTLVTSMDQIVSGKRYIIASGTEGNVVAMGEQKTNNRGIVDVTVTEYKIPETAGVYEIVINGPDAEGHYTIYDVDVTKGGYLYAAGTGSANNLKTQSFNTERGIWTISLSGDAADITSITTATDRKIIRYNSNNSCFSCYSGNQADIYLYVKDVNPSYDYYKDIAAYTGDKDNYYLIASPIDDIDPADVGMITDDNTDPENRLYDLYWFDQTQDQEWQNYRQGAFDLVSGSLGYLYANKNNVTLHFSGTPNTEGIVSVSLVKDDDVNWSGWNLIGNPFGEAAVLNMAFYTMNEAGDGFMAQTEGSTVNAMEGVFVKAENDGDEATFTAVSNFGFGSGSGGGADPLDEGYLNLSVNKTLGGFVDNAIVRFDGGAMLSKFQLFPNSTKVFITENGKDYAIVRAQNEGEMPISFKAENNGTYTLSVEPKNVDMTYLHLIDNKTGADVDLLATPSYSFEAKTTDYASRFRLVFNANSSNENETFAFFNGSEWMISNMGEATLQVVDVMGRVLSTETVNGNATMNLNQTPGVYMLRLVNGDSVKVQKVVVR